MRLLYQNLTQWRSYDDGPVARRRSTLDPVKPLMELMPPPHSIRVLVADDHERIRCALGAVLASPADIEVIGMAADGSQAVAMAATLAPDVILMDVSMPGVDGITATRRIRAANPRVRVVIFTAFGDRQEEAYRAGASAHLLKDCAPEELVRCVRATAAA
jgi:DNA-binding NarL/FixJ family response regulator